MLKLLRSERQSFPSLENQGLYCDIYFFEGNIRKRVWNNGCVEWVKDNLLHRIDGYAYYSTLNGEVISGFFYLQGKLYSRENWLNSLTEEQQIEALFNIDEWR